MQMGREFDQTSSSTNPSAFNNKPSTFFSSSSLMARLFTNDEPLVCAL
jgi:hypothetical protein